MCQECDHVVSKSFIKNNCKSHPTAELRDIHNCPVEFVYAYPQSLYDQRRWIGGNCLFHICLSSTKSTQPSHLP